MVNLDQVIRGIENELRNPPGRFVVEGDENEVCWALFRCLQGILLQRGFELTHQGIDPETRHNIIAAANWLRDPGGTPGLMLMGTIGNGKTSLARAIAKLISLWSYRQQNKNIRVPVYTAKEIVELRMGYERSVGASGEYDSLTYGKFLVIDDLGEDPAEVLLFGMNLTPLADIISRRYSRSLITIITTNLQSQELKERYGGRVYDRLREMMTTIAFLNPSFRGN